MLSNISLNTGEMAKDTYTASRTFHVSRIDRTSCIRFELSCVDTSLIHTNHLLAAFSTILNHPIVHSDVWIEGTAHNFTLDVFAVNRNGVRRMSALRNPRLDRSFLAVKCAAIYVAEKKGTELFSTSYLVVHSFKKFAMNLGTQQRVLFPCLLTSLKGRKLYLYSTST